MSRFALCVVACVAGCSPAEPRVFYANPSEVTGATIRSLLPVAEDGEVPPPVKLSVADAEAVYAALKGDEPNQINSVLGALIAS